LESSACGGELSVQSLKVAVQGTKHGPRAAQPTPAYSAWPDACTSRSCHCFGFTAVAPYGWYAYQHHKNTIAVLVVTSDRSSTAHAQQQCCAWLEAWSLAGNNSEGWPGSAHFLLLPLKVRYSVTALLAVPLPVCCKPCTGLTRVTLLIHSVGDVVVV
jgi:hypothetical protein